MRYGVRCQDYTTCPMAADNFTNLWNSYGNASRGDNSLPEVEQTQRPTSQQSTTHDSGSVSKDAKQKSVVTKLQANYASYFTEICRDSAEKSNSSISHYMTDPTAFDDDMSASDNEVPYLYTSDESDRLPPETFKPDGNPFCIAETIRSVGKISESLNTDFDKKYLNNTPHTVSAVKVDAARGIRMELPTDAFDNKIDVGRNVDVDIIAHKSYVQKSILQEQTYLEKAVASDDESTVASINSETHNINTNDQNTYITINNTLQADLKTYLANKLERQKSLLTEMQMDDTTEFSDADIKAVESTIDSLKTTDFSRMNSPSKYSPMHKQYKCDICKVSFGFRSNLIRHKKTAKHIQNDMKLTYMSDMVVDSIASDDDTENPMAALTKIDQFIQKQALIPSTDDVPEQPVDSIKDEGESSEERNTRVQTSEVNNDITKTTAYTDIIDTISGPEKEKESTVPPKPKPADLVVFEKNIEHLTQSINAISDDVRNKPGEDTAVKNSKTSEESRTCNACHKVFPAERFLITHLRRKHDVYIPLTCTVCGKTFSNKGDLRKHVRIHSKDNPYSCELCNRSFKQKIHLKSHYRCHNEERDFSCTFCQATFKHKNNMTMHLRIHTGERPFACSICDKTFTHNTNLKVHLRLHSGQKKYQCEVCSRDFTQKHHLKRHRNIHVNGVYEQRFDCETCFRVYTQRHHYRRHLRRHLQEGTELTHAQMAVIAETKGSMDDSDLMDDDAMDMDIMNESVDVELSRMTKEDATLVCDTEEDGMTNLGIKYESVELGTGEMTAT